VSTRRCASRPKTVPGWSVSSGTVPARRSRSNVCTLSAPPPPSPRPTAAFSTASRNRTSTAAPRCYSRLSSSSRPSPSSFRPRESIATATTVFWLRTPHCGRTSWPSAGPRRRRPKGFHFTGRSRRAGGVAATTLWPATCNTGHLGCPLRASAHGRSGQRRGLPGEARGEGGDATGTALGVEQPP
jgi:hypothetical protein